MFFLLHITFNHKDPFTKVLHSFGCPVGIWIIHVRTNLGWNISISVFIRSHDQCNCKTNQKAWQAACKICFRFLDNLPNFIYILIYIWNMPGRNCAFPGCTVSHTEKHKGITVFKIPGRRDEFYSTWRKTMCDVLSRYRQMDTLLKQRIEKGLVHICERHFPPEDIEFTSKFIYIALQGDFINYIWLKKPYMYIYAGSSPTSDLSNSSLVD